MLDSSPVMDHLCYGDTLRVYTDTLIEHIDTLREHNNRPETGQLTLGSQRLDFVQRVIKRYRSVSGQ